VASDDLISDYRARLARELPTAVVDELLDGLEETRDRLSSQGLAPEAAAAAAVHEFGQPAQVIKAFTRSSPGRRQALRLLATGPVFALLWGTALITSRAWTWPVPRPLEIAFGVTLLAVVGVLVTVLATTHLAKTRRAGYAGVALVMLDLAMLSAVAFAAPTLTWVMGPAIAASLIRITTLTPRLPSILAG
jgi:hypothetical protein